MKVILIEKYPLKAAKDAYLIKTDNLSITQSFEKVMEIIRGKEQ